MVHSDKWFLQSTCPTDKYNQFEISKPDVHAELCCLITTHFQNKMLPKILNKLNLFEILVSTFLLIAWYHLDLGHLKAE